MNAHVWSAMSLRDVLNSLHNQATRLTKLSDDESNLSRDETHLSRDVAAVFMRCVQVIPR